MIALFAGILGAGCYSYETLTVSVRDRGSHQPIAGAVVEVHPLDPRHPIHVGDILNPFKPDDHSGVTDARGVVRVRGALDRPLEIGVMCRGYEPGVVSFDGVPAQPGIASEWACVYGAEAPSGWRLWEVSITR